MRITDATRENSTLYSFRTVETGSRVIPVPNDMDPDDVGDYITRTLREDDSYPTVTYLRYEKAREWDVEYFYGDMLGR